MRKVYEVAGKRHPGEKRALNRNFSRWGKQGAIAHDLAAAVLKVLEVGQAELQAPYGAPEWTARLRRQLEAQLDLGTNARLQEALAQEHGLHAVDPLGSLTLELARQLERAQLGQQPQRLAELAALTGWPVQQLLQARDVQGHWLLTPGGADSSYAELWTSLVQVTSRIEEVVSPLLVAPHTDARLVLRQEQPWMYVEAQGTGLLGGEPPGTGFVRARPHAGGLQWTNLTQDDLHALDVFLRPWAFNTANFVEWRGETFPRDVQHLCLVVQRRKSDGKWEQIELIRPPAMSEGHRSRAAAQACSHGATVEGLLAPAAHALSAQMRAWPPECWSMGLAGGWIQMVLHVRVRLALERQVDPMQRPQLQVGLCEEREGVLVDAPWRARCRNAAVEQLRTRLEAVGVLGAAEPAHAAATARA